MLYAIFGVAYTYTRADPILMTKIAAPLLYSGLGAAEFAFAIRTLAWSETKSLSLSLISSIYFASLTLSWDLFRNTLGLIILFPALGLLSQQNLTRRKRVVFIAISWLVVVSHLLVGAIFLGIVLIKIIQFKERRVFRVLATIPAWAQFISALAAFQLGGTGIVAVENSAVQPWSAYTNMLLVLLPLLPMAFIGVRSATLGTLRSWISICLIGAVLGTTPLSTSSQIVSPDRWSLMLAVPVVIIAVEGYSRLDTKTLRKWFRPRGMFKLSWISIITLLGVTFLVLPASQPFPYFTYLTPTSMLQSTVPLTDSQSLVTTISWLSANALPGAVIMADHAIYGWLREYYRGNATVITYQSGVSLQRQLTMTLGKGYQTIYTIWWVDHFGWYGQPTVPTGFQLTHVDGRMGVFLYFA